MSVVTRNDIQHFAGHVYLHVGPCSFLDWLFRCPRIVHYACNIRSFSSAWIYHPNTKGKIIMISSYILGQIEMLQNCWANVENNILCKLTSKSDITCWARSYHMPLIINNNYWPFPHCTWSIIYFLVSSAKQQSWGSFPFKTMTHARIERKAGRFEPPTR